MKVSDRFFDWMIEIFGYRAYVMMEDIFVLVGGAFIGIILVILCLAKRLHNFEELPEDYHDHFSVVRYEEVEGEPLKIMLKVPRSYKEAVDLIISLLALGITGKHHSRKHINRAKHIIKILLAIMGIILIIAWFFIRHIATPILT